MNSNVCRISKHDVEIWNYEDHWGELPKRTKKSMPPEVCEAVIMGSVKQEGPKDHFPGLSTFKVVPTMEELKEQVVVLPPNTYPANEVIRHTIKLNLYCKKLRTFIELLDSQKKRYRGPLLSQVARKIPAMKIPTKEPQIFNFNLGQGHQMPSLDQKVIYEMLEKAVIVMLAQVGYERTEKAALHILVDVVKEMIVKICSFCHMFGQKDLNRGQVSYTDVLEKSLRTVGLDGILSVHDYYKKKIILKHDQAHTKAKKLLADYEKLVIKHGLTGNVPQIHFASSKQNSQTLHAILQPGYKMLQTLDQAHQNNGEGSNHQ